MKIVSIAVSTKKGTSKKCAIFYRTGDCIMPKEGVFARIIKAGTIKVGDPIKGVAR